MPFYHNFFVSSKDIHNYYQKNIKLAIEINRTKVLDTKIITFGIIKA